MSESIRKAAKLSIGDDGKYSFELYLERGTFYSTRRVEITDTSIDLNLLMKYIAGGDIDLTEIQRDHGDFFVNMDGHKVLIGSWQTVDCDCAKLDTIEFRFDDSEVPSKGLTVDSDEVEGYDFAFGEEPKEEDEDEAVAAGSARPELVA